MPDWSHSPPHSVSLRWPLAQEPGWFEDQHQDQYRKDKGARPFRGEILIAAGVEKTDDVAAQHRATDIPNASQDRGSKGQKTGVKTHQVTARVQVDADHHAGRTGEGAAYKERVANHRFDVG